MIDKMVDTPRSSCISSMGYDRDTRELMVVFKKGGKYVFSNVPENIYTECIKSNSVGKYFHSRIEKHYSYRKVY